MILGYSRVFGTPLPLTNLVVQIDASDATKIWQISTPGNNPYWSVPGVDTFDAAVVESTVPGPTSQISLGCETGLEAVAPIWQVAASPMTHSSILFDGIQDRCLLQTRTGTSYAPFSGLLPDTDKTILVSFQIHSASLNDPVNAELNHPIIYDSNKRDAGILFRNDSGTYKVQFWNYDGNSDFVEFNVLLNTNYVACFRHDGTNVYGSINGGTESSTPSGTPTNNGGAIRVAGDGARFSNISIGEILLYNLALTEATTSKRSDAIAYMTGKWL